MPSCIETPAGKSPPGPLGEAERPEGAPGRSPLLSETVVARLRHCLDWLFENNPQTAENSPCVLGVIAASAVLKAYQVPHTLHVGMLAIPGLPRLPGSGHAWCRLENGVIIDILRDRANCCYLSIDRPERRGVQYIDEPWRMELITRHQPAIEQLRLRIEASAFKASLRVVQGAQ